MKLLPRILLRMLAIALMFGGWLWGQSRLVDYLALGFAISQDRASGLLGVIDMGTLTILMIHHVWAKLFAPSKPAPEDP